MAQRIQLRRDTAANWTAANPVLAQGEAGAEIDSNKLKIGDGTTPWATLPYVAGGTGGSTTPPATPTTGTSYVDRSVVPSVVKVWNGTAWVAQTGTAFVSGTAPTAPVAGQVWVNNSTVPATTKMWDGTTWVTMTVDSATQAKVDAQTATNSVIASELLYSRRPPLHRNSLFQKTAAATLSVVAGAVLNGKRYAAATAVSMPTHASNTDYAIWQHPTTGALVADASFTTAPTAAAGGSIVGGYHYIPAGRPTAFNDGGKTTGAEILEYSIWDLSWRPACPDPRGMACIAGGFWIDLYMCGATSYAGDTFSAVPSSRIGLTIADGTSPPLVPALYGGDGSAKYADGKWYVFGEVARSFGKRLPNYEEFSAATFGAPEQTSRGTDPGTVIWERVSKFGLAQATGTLWTWAQETCTTTQPAAWTTGTETAGRGQVYGAETRALLLGGNWDYTANSGSRCAFWATTPWYSSNNIGARFVAGHLVLG